MGLKSKSLDKVRADVPVSKEALARVNFNLPESTHAVWKIAAAKQRRSLAAMVTEAVEKYLQTIENTH
jgi:predicted HicB family RNase H-like nuclease